jgi:Family of unknown function (DUF6505)
MRFLRTIRLDASDEHVFERAAGPDEWAVSGAFAFADLDPARLGGKAQQAFTSFGRSTLVAIGEIKPEELEGVIEALALHFLERYGAPSVEAARAAARGEVEFAISLCEHRINTLLAVEREFGTDGIIERFRVIRPRGPASHARIWTIVDDETDP